MARAALGLTVKTVSEIAPLRAQSITRIEKDQCGVSLHMKERLARHYTDHHRIEFQKNRRTVTVPEY
jgi:DNA-binding XRE family transcriptional regulator